MRHQAWVIKFSKLCNLRCEYCYEYSELGNSDKMPLDRIKNLVANIASHVDMTGVHPSIIWHGGEPFALGEKYISNVFTIIERYQKLVDKSRVQTNLTYALTPKKIALLRKFSSIGVSFDPYSKSRLNIVNEDSSEKVLKNMAYLQSQQITFACINVMHKENYDVSLKALQFFMDVGISYKVLPFYKYDNMEQFNNFDMESEIIIERFNLLTENWLHSGSNIKVFPFIEFVEIASRFIMKRPLSPNNFSDGCSNIIVDTDGEVYFSPTSYKIEYSIGNALLSDINLEKAKKSSRSAIESSYRVKAICGGCPYRKYCDHKYIAEATDIEIEHLKENLCFQKQCIDFSVDILVSSGAGWKSFSNRTRIEWR